MNYIYYNPNPIGKHTGDCVIQALCKVLDKPWEEIYIGLARTGLLIYETMESNATWDLYLRNHGFSRHSIPNTCPDCYTVADFCRDNPIGQFVLGMGDHAVAIENGMIFSTWDCSNEIPIYYYERED